MRIRFIIILCLVFSSTVYAQYAVEGKVIDKSDKQPLAFVNIGIVGSQEGCSSNIDGQFKLISSKPITEITVTYVGYESLTYTVKSEKAVVIRMNKKEYKLSEVEIRPGENPANRIIKLVTKNRDKNNPDKIQSYICNTYSKTYYDLVYNTNELQNKADSLQADSLKEHLRLFSDNSHIMMMESVTERRFLYPENLNEKVIATKVSGFKEPSFSTSATDIQPFSFYNDYFKVLGKDYLNPITAGSTTKYFFNLEDTLYQGNDSVYIISYRPFKGKNFDGLEGVLYINTNGYAIQNVIAQPYDKGLIDLKIQQQYQVIDGKQWFPEQLNYELSLKKYPSRLVGMKLTGKSYINDVKLNTNLRKKDFGFKTVEMEFDAAHKNPEYWNVHRLDTLDNKEKKTYKVLDSLGEANHFDRALKIVESLTTFQFPVSIINIDLNKIIGINDYEKFRIGLGAHTNERLSKWFGVGGYVGFGYKDAAAKYGGDFQLNLKPNNKDYFIKLAYSKDLAEPGKTQYFYPSFNINRNIMTYRMDYLEQEELSLNFRAFRYLTANIALNNSLRKPHYDYLFLPDKNDLTEVATEFKSTEVRLKGRYAYKEHLVQAFGQMLSDGTKYPVVYFAYTKGFKMSQYGNYDYNKISVGVEKRFLIKNIGKTHLLLEGGYLKGNVPYSYLFNGNGSYAKDNYLYVENTFQTMGLYEFVSNQYVNLFFSHNFGSLLFKQPKFQPQFVIVTNAGYGSMDNPELHKNINFKTMEKGFFESGLFINNVIRANYLNIAYIGVGGGVFMRYGAYANTNMKDNVAYKISLVLSF